MVKASRPVTKAVPWATKVAQWVTRVIKVARAALWETRAVKAAWVVLIVVQAASEIKARAQVDHQVLETWIALQVKV